MNLNLPTILRFSDDKLPEFKEVKGKDYILYGEKNDYPDELLELFNRSPKHNAIVAQKAAYISGDSVNLDGNLTVEQKALAEKAMSDFNRYEDYEEVRRKFDLDVELYGGGALEVIWSRDKQRIAEVHHVDFTKVRTNKDHSEFYIAEEWSAYMKKDDITVVPAYSAMTRESRQIYYYCEYRSGQDVYPLPGYIGGRQYIATDVEISNWHYNNLKNGFSNGMLLQLFKGTPTDEEAREATRKFKKQTTGTDNAGGILIQFNEKDEQPAAITPIQPSELDKQFVLLNETVQQEIFIAHRVTSPMLFGVRVASELGGRNELMQAYRLFHKSYVAPKQKKHDRLFSEFFSLMIGQPVKITSVNNDPIEIDSMELFDKGIYTVNEMREKLGLPVTPKPELGDAQLLVDSINNLSPLVANKVLNELTVNEVRKLAGLPPVVGGDEVSRPSDGTDAPVQMSKDNPFGWKDSDIEVFARYGVSADEVEEVLPGKFAALSDAEKAVITLLADNPKITTAQVSEITKLSPQEVSTIVKSLTESKLIKPGGGGTIVITPGGEQAIDDSGGQEVKIFTMWQYAKDPGVPGAAVLDTTRDFCREMMAQNRMYTREDIDAMSAELGYDVWRRRGGWYTNPQTGYPTAYCRHVWQQKLVRRKVK